MNTRQAIGLSSAVVFLLLGIYIANPLAWVPVFIVILFSLSFATGRVPRPQRHTLPFRVETGYRDPNLFPDLMSDPAVNGSWMMPSSDTGEVVRRLDEIKEKL